MQGRLLTTTTTWETWTSTSISSRSSGNEYSNNDEIDNLPVKMMVPNLENMMSKLVKKVAVQCLLATPASRPRRNERNMT